MLPHQRICTNGLDQPAQIHQAQIGSLSHQCFQALIYTKTLLISNHSMIVFIYISKLVPCMPHSIGLSPMNTPYGMLQLKH